MSWFIFINRSLFLCVVVSPKVILSKTFLVSRKILDVKGYVATTPKIYVAATPRTASEKIYVAATPRTALLQHYEQQLKKNYVAATLFPENKFFCFSELKTEYFSVSKTVLF